MDALGDILTGREEWKKWGLTTETKVLLMGHSNGGQGVWYVAARYPDRVIGGTCRHVYHSAVEIKLSRLDSHHDSCSCRRVYQVSSIRSMDPVEAGNPVRFEGIVI